MFSLFLLLLLGLVLNFQGRDWLPPVCEGGELLIGPGAVVVVQEGRKHVINYRALRVVTETRKRVLNVIFEVA